MKYVIVDVPYKRLRGNERTLIGRVRTLTYAVSGEFDLGSAIRIPVVYEPVDGDEEKVKVSIPDMVYTKEITEAIAERIQTAFKEEAHKVVQLRR